MIPARKLRKRDPLYQRIPFGNKAAVEDTEKTQFRNDKDIENGKPVGRTAFRFCLLSLIFHDGFWEIMMDRFNPPDLFPFADGDGEPG